MPYDPTLYAKREAAAVAVLEKAGIKITPERVTAAPLCPTWGRPKALEAGFPRGSCRLCGQTHGDHYRITIQRMKEKIGTMPELPTASYAFDFWGAYADTREAADNGEPGRGRPWGKTYRAPDVIDCILSDLTYEQTPDEIYAEFGPMEPSACLAIAEHAAKLRQVIPDAVADEARAALDGRDEEE